MVAGRSHRLSLVLNACRSCGERIQAAVVLFAGQFWNAMGKWMIVVVAVVRVSCKVHQRIGFLWKRSRCKAVYGSNSYSPTRGHCGFPLTPSMLESPSHWSQGNIRSFKAECSKANNIHLKLFQVFDVKGQGLLSLRHEKSTFNTIQRAGTSINQ